MFLCLCVFRNAPMCTQKKAGGGRIGVCREVHRKSSKENFATIRGPRRRPARPGRPSPASFLPPCKGRIQSSRWGALRIRRSLSRASAATPARRHLVRVGSLKFGRLWAMRRRKDDGECRAMMGTAMTTATNNLQRYIRTNIYLL